MIISVYANFQGVGHPEPLFGCNGDEIRVADESHQDADAGKYFPIGSLIVKPGAMQG